MKKKDIIGIVNKYKYVMIGEIHGTTEIPKIVFDIIKCIKNEKIIFCLEIPEQAERELYLYLNNKIKEDEFLYSNYISDAVHDKRITASILNLCENLNNKGVIIRGLEDYNLTNIDERDKTIADNFVKLVNTIKADKYFIYVGNMHTFDKQIKIENFVVNPLKLYIPNEILDKLLTIQFDNSESEEIEYDTKSNVINYKIKLVKFKVN